MLKTCCENVRKNVPLVHNITNYVTVNDVANVTFGLRRQPNHVRRAGGCGGYHCHLQRPEYQHRNPA